MMRIVKIGVVAALIVAAISPVLAMPAEACSCASPGHLGEWVDESEAVFVGTMVEKIDGGQDPFGGPGAIYVFEVETWVKGDLGDVIEVHSSVDGAACGFEFWDQDMRTGAAIYEENGVLNGGLCSQVDPDVLLAAMEGPTPSATGIPKLIVSNGWSSTRLSVLDDVGNHVTDLIPPVDEPEFSGTQFLKACPGGEYVAQLTTSHVVVWDTATLEVATIHDIGQSQTAWPTDLACLNSDATSIQVFYTGDTSSTLVQVAPEHEEIAQISGVNGFIGHGFVVYQKGHDGDAVMLDLETGVETPLTSKAPNSLVGIYPAPHPTEPLVAIVETRYPADGGPTQTVLNVFDDRGELVFNRDIADGEGYSPTWLTDDSVGLIAYTYTDDLTETAAYIYDLAGGEDLVIEDWSGWTLAVDEGYLLGVEAGTIVTADLETGELGELVTIPSQEAGPLLVVNSDTAVEPVTTTTAVAAEPESTTPPLVAAEPGDDDAIDYRWLAGGALIFFIGILAWLTVRKPRQDS